MISIILNIILAIGCGISIAYARREHRQAEYLEQLNKDRLYGLR